MRRRGASNEDATSTEAAAYISLSLYRSLPTISRRSIAATTFNYSPAVAILSHRVYHAYRTMLKSHIDSIFRRRTAAAAGSSSRACRGPTILLLFPLIVVDWQPAAV